MKDNIALPIMAIKGLLTAHLFCAMLGYSIAAWASTEKGLLPHKVIYGQHNLLCREVAKQFQYHCIPNSSKEGKRWMTKNCFHNFVPNTGYLNYVSWKLLEDIGIPSHIVRKYVTDINNDGKEETVISLFTVGGSIFFNYIYVFPSGLHYPYRVKSNKVNIYEDFPDKPTLEINKVDLTYNVKKYVEKQHSETEDQGNYQTTIDIFSYKGRNYLLGVSPRHYGYVIVMDLGLPEKQQEVCLLRHAGNSYRGIEGISIYSGLQPLVERK